MEKPTGEAGLLNYCATMHFKSDPPLGRRGDLQLCVIAVPVFRLEKN